MNSGIVPLILPELTAMVIYPLPFSPLTSLYHYHIHSHTTSFSPTLPCLSLSFSRCHLTAGPPYFIFFTSFFFLSSFPRNDKAKQRFRLVHHLASQVSLSFFAFLCFNLPACLIMKGDIIIMILLFALQPHIPSLTQGRSRTTVSEIKEFRLHHLNIDSSHIRRQYYFYNKF